MGKIYNVTIKRACAANNSQMSVDVKVEGNIEIPLSKDDKNNFFKSITISQHPNISKPCKLGEFDVLSISEKSSTTDKTKTNAQSKTKTKKVSEKKSKPIWLSLLLLPFKIIGWLFNKLLWKQL